MTGYFSQLAYHTGLTFEAAASNAASTFASEPVRSVPASESEPSGPPDVEEFTFTAASAPDANEGSSEGHPTLRVRDRSVAGTMEVRSPQQSESTADAHRQSSEATARQSDAAPGLFREESRIAFTDSPSATRNPRKLSAENQFPARELPALLPDKSSGAERRSLPVESVAIPYDAIEMVERQPARQDPPADGRQPQRPEAKQAEQAKPVGDREVVDAVREQHVERETIVRNYLKEIRAWVSAPPELDQRELELPRDSDRRLARHDAERSVVGRSDVFALEREVLAATPQPAQSESLEVQDLNLSIGTISIVIEEPKQIAHAAVPSPTGMESSPGSRASEPTRLSRYYLERW
jgi:hypothetical protein